MLTFFYAIGAGAITFAIEREEGTQLRPVMLGCPTGLTLIVKTVFGIVAIALLLAITICSGMLMSLGSLTLPESAMPPDTRMVIPAGLLFVVVPYLGGLLWSMFFSLLTRKVVVALGLTVIAMIFAYILVVATFTAIPRNELNGLKIMVVALPPCLLLLFLLASNYLLTHRWLTRTFFDQSIAKSPSFFRRWRIRRSGLDGGMIVEIGVEDRTAFEVVKPELVNHLPPPRFGLSLLYVNWGPNLWRHLRFLRWKEALETRKLFVGFLVVAAVIVVLTVDRRAGRGDWHYLISFFIHVACVASGVMVFRAEQDDRHFQRLADMGLRPRTVWLSKHLVWLTRACISVLVILMCAFVMDWVRSLFGRDSVFEEIWLGRQFRQYRTQGDTELLILGRGIISILTCYGIGQVCSQLIRSTIVAVFVAFVLALAAFGWSLTCTVFEVPWTLSVLPLAIGCLLVTWFRTGSWMLDDIRARTWIRPATAITVVIAIAYFGAGLFRVYQIPAAVPFFVDTDSSSADFNDGLTADQRVAMLAPLTEQEKQTFALYQRASDLMGRNRVDQRAAGPRTVQRILDALSEDGQLESVEEATRLALEAAESSACADFVPAKTNIADVWHSTALGSLHNAFDLVLFDARRQMESGNVDVALDRYRSDLSISHHTAGRGADTNWWSSINATRNTLRAIREWAEHPDVDARLIETATKIIDNHGDQMIAVEVANYSQAVMIRNTLDADSFALAAEMSNPQKRFNMLLSTRFPGERARSHRLLNALESYDVATMASYRTHQAAVKAGTAKGMAPWYRDQVQLRKAKEGYESVAHASLPSIPFFAMVAGREALDENCRPMIDAECWIRATKVMLRLLQEKRESGELPADLADFDETLNDPWNGQPFTWYPEGLPGDFMRDSWVLVKANTPFLMSTGHTQTQLQRVEYTDFPPVDEQTAYFSAMTGDPPAERNPADGKLRVEYKLEVKAYGAKIWTIPAKAAYADADEDEDEDEDEAAEADDAETDETSEADKAE
jgi:hypothetical protein